MGGPNQEPFLPVGNNETPTQRANRNRKDHAILTKNIKREKLHQKKAKQGTKTLARSSSKSTPNHK